MQFEFENLLIKVMCFIRCGIFSVLASVLVITGMCNIIRYISRYFFHIFTKFLHRVLILP